MNSGSRAEKERSSPSGKVPGGASVSAERADYKSQTWSDCMILWRDRRQEKNGTWPMNVFAAS